MDFQLNSVVQPINALRIGIDVGSTTVKVLVLDAKQQIIYKVYTRHHSEVRDTVNRCIQELAATKLCPKDSLTSVVITGSGGMDIANILQFTFIQEVIACTKAVETFIPNTDVSIELGGEDAKITFFTHGVEQRMNGSCAGGTGAFIDQMASLLKADSIGFK